MSGGIVATVEGTFTDKYASLVDVFSKSLDDGADVGASVAVDPQG